MPTIRVDPAVLNSSANNLTSSAGGISNAGNNAHSAASSAPSYDGQFGPKVKAIGNEARAISQNRTNLINNLSVELKNKASIFSSVDSTPINSFRQNGSYGLSIGPNNPLLKFGNYPLQNYENVSFSKLQNLGNLSNGEMNTTFPSGYINNPNSSLLSPSINIDLATSKEILKRGRGRPKDDRIGFGINIPIVDYVWNEADIPAPSFLPDQVKEHWVGKAEYGKIDGGINLGINDHEEFTLGPNFGISGIHFDGSWADSGDSLLGTGSGVEIDLLHFDSFAGMKDGNFGLKMEADVASIGISKGININGVGVGVTAEAHAGWEFGFVVGKENEIAFGPVSIGLEIGKTFGK